MTEAQFAQQLERLSKEWPRSYSDERAQRIWQYVRQMPFAEFERVVNKMLDDCKSAPLPKDFREALIAFKNQNVAKASMPPIEEFDRSRKADCLLCSDDGTVRAYRRSGHKAADGKGYVYRFACECDAGNEFSKSLPRWGFSRHDLFELVKAGA